VKVEEEQPIKEESHQSSGSGAVKRQREDSATEEVSKQTL